MKAKTVPPPMDAVFSASTTHLSEDEAQALTYDAYGLRVRATLLTSERDQNFLVRTLDDTRRAFVLKTTHAAESRGVTDFQTQAQLRLMAARPALPVPELIPTRDGAPIYWLETTGTDDVIPHGTDDIKDDRRQKDPHQGPEARSAATREAACEADLDRAAVPGKRAVRLSTFLPGRPMHELPRTAAMCASLGAMLAHFDAALSDFHHPSATHELLWDLQHAAKLRPLLAYIDDDARRHLATRYMDRFESVIQPQLATLRRQVIHNDANPYNVFFDDAGLAVTGIIDFGDMVAAPLINELGVACSYQLVPGDNPLRMASACVSAYHDVTPLRPEELALLPDIIATRLLLTVVITTWRAALHPENRRYILRNNPLSWAGLEMLDALPAGEAERTLRRACEFARQSTGITNNHERSRSIANDANPPNQPEQDDRNEQEVR